MRICQEARYSLQGQQTKRRKPSRAQKQGRRLGFPAASEARRAPPLFTHKLGGQVSALNFWLWKLQLDLVETRKEQ